MKLRRNKHAAQHGRKIENLRSATPSGFADTDGHDADTRPEGGRGQRKSLTWPARPAR